MVYCLCLSGSSKGSRIAFLTLTRDRGRHNISLLLDSNIDNSDHMFVCVIVAECMSNAQYASKARPVQVISARRN